MHARARHLAIGNRHLHVHVRVHRAFRLQVADGRESVRKRDLRVACGEDRAIRNRLLQQLRVVFLGCDVALQQDVRMGIDETRQNRGLRKVYHLHPGRRASSCYDGRDLVAFNYDQHILERLVAFPIDQLSRTDGNAVCGLTRGEHRHYEAQPQRNKDTAHQKFLPQRRKSLSETANFVASCECSTRLELPVSTNPPRKCRQPRGLRLTFAAWGSARGTLLKNVLELTSQLT